MATDKDNGTSGAATDDVTGGVATDKTKHKMPTVNIVRITRPPHKQKSDMKAMSILLNKNITSDDLNLFIVSD